VNLGVNALVLALALAATPAPVPGWVVVQRDGSVVQLRQEPLLKGDVLVGTLFPEGSFVSIRVENVDETKTAAANRQRKGGLDSTPAHPLVSGAMPLADRVRLAPPTGTDAAHRQLDAARKVLAEALAERNRYERSRPAGGPSSAWAAGLQERLSNLEKARRRVDAARKRAEAVEASGP
jgi:hypothetical protein